jgi:hypothetical protein
MSKPVELKKPLFMLGAAPGAQHSRVHKRERGPGLGVAEELLSLLNGHEPARKIDFPLIVTCLGALKLEDASADCCRFGKPQGSKIEKKKKRWSVGILRTDF